MKFLSAWLLVLILVAARAEAREPAWRYEIHLGKTPSVIDVDAWFAADCPRELKVANGAAPYVKGLTLPVRNGRWTLPAGARHVRYRVLLREALLNVKGERGAVHGEVLTSAPGIFLLHPHGEKVGRTYQLKVVTSPGCEFVCGMRKVGDVYESAVEDVDDGSRTAFGPMDVASIDAGGTRLIVASSTKGLPMSAADTRAWVQSKADAVAKYYGRFPVAGTAFFVCGVPGTKVSGRTDGGSGATIEVTVGSATKPDAVKRNWTLTHEMVHTAFPGVHYTHHWIEEGIATYVEPILRVKAGDEEADKVWSKLVKDLPRGEPEKGDKGLDRTPTWGRTYWGGALFCFVADLQIRVATQDKKSLRDALRGILDAGGDLTKDWPLKKALAAADAATGTRVMQTLYAQWSNTPVTVDLGAWWKKLGISVPGGKITYDDAAPLASIRKAFMAPY